mmetsp:Transcript_51228/g.122748  ORF Transcript_51228/g.122748 Transcript_51228/m.122748 type:complete len:204 (+) Transcript_51228:1026-1637(+)
MKDRIPLLLLKNALVASFCQLRPEPLVIGVLLHLLQRDDVCSHRLQLLHDEVLPPSPGQGPLLAVRIDRLGGIQIGQDIPIHHLELLVQPLCVESGPVGDHAATACLLGRGDDSPSGDGHAAGGCIAAALDQGSDLQAEGPINVLFARAVRPSVGHLHPLSDLLLLVHIVLRAPHRLRNGVVALEKALLGAVTQVCLRHIFDL